MIVRKLSESEFELDVSGVKTVSFKVFLQEVNEMVRKLGYKNRSGLIRDAVTEHIRYLRE
mgnify:CR=1 FL=1